MLSPTRHAYSCPATSDSEALPWHGQEKKNAKTNAQASTQQCLQGESNPKLSRMAEAAANEAECQWSKGVKHIADDPLALQMPAPIQAEFRAILIVLSSQCSGHNRYSKESSKEFFF